MSALRHCAQVLGDVSGCVLLCGLCFVVLSQRLKLFHPKIRTRFLHLL